MNRRSLFKTFAGLAAVPAAEKLASGETGVGGLDRYRDLVTHGNRFDGWAPINRMQSIALGRNDHEVAVISPAATGKTELAIVWMLEPTINMRAEDRKHFVGLLTASEWVGLFDLAHRAKGIYGPVGGEFIRSRMEFVFPGGERVLVRARFPDLPEGISGFSFSRQAHDGIVNGSDFLVAKRVISLTSRSVSGSSSSLITMRHSVSCFDFPWDYLNFPHSYFDTSLPMIAWMNYSFSDGTPSYGNILL